MEFAALNYKANFITNIRQNYLCLLLDIYFKRKEL